MFPLVMRKANRRVFAAKRGKRITAYALGRPGWRKEKGRRDWQLEELAGSGEGILSILRWLVRKEDVNWVRGGLPFAHTDYLRPLLRASDGWATQVSQLCQIKVVDLDAALDALGARDLKASVRKLKLPVTDQARLLFGPLSPNELVCNGPVRRRLAGRLPLPFYLWPSDHV
jgi:hypothetical protein